MLPAGFLRQQWPLACRLGYGDRFWNGDVDAAYRHQLGPSGVSLDALRERPEGVRVRLRTRYRKYAEEKDGVPIGFATVGASPVARDSQEVACLIACSEDPQILPLFRRDSIIWGLR
jgi:hypothetical protein